MGSSAPLVICVRGTPLPYLFILAKEILSLKLDLLRSGGHIAPISPVSSTPCQLLYVDDILLFLEAHKSGLRRLQDLLRLYQDSSGQCFNLQKSFLFLGKCNARNTNMVTGLLQISVDHLPSVYLGVPLFYCSARHIYYFQKILDSIRSKLAGWKTKCLSFAGRLTLVRHVLSSIPLHISLVLPSKTCLQIEGLMRKFLWFANPDKSRSNLVR